MQPSPAVAACEVRRLGLTPYREAWDEQRRLVAACRDDGRPRLLLLEHPPVYTLGARGREDGLRDGRAALERLGAEVVRVDRGGDVTFHGPGQLVGYPVLDLKQWGQGPLWYVRALEAVLIETAAAFGITATRLPGRPGVWVDGAKLAAIGVHVSRGITSHGFALNVSTDVAWFAHIVPCGIPGVRITSMAELLGTAPSMPEVMDATVDTFARVFELEMRDGGRTVAASAWAPTAAR